MSTTTPGEPRKSLTQKGRNLVFDPKCIVAYNSSLFSRSDGSE